MNEVVAGTTVLAGALVLIIWAIRQAVNLPSRTVPLLAIVLGALLYYAAYAFGPLASAGDPFSAIIAGITAGGSAVGIHQGVLAATDHLPSSLASPTHKN